MHRNPIPKKHLGQNFLKSEAVLGRFIKTCDFSRQDTAVEVGGGTGIITKAIAPLVKKLVTYEFDASLAEEYLIPLKQVHPNLEVVNADVLISLGGGQKLEAIVGAIPYQISSPLLHRVVGEFYGVEKRPKVIFIMQREVVEKVSAAPPKASYLSNLVSLYGRAEIVGPPIPPNAFWPAPKVESAILRIIPHGEKLVAAGELASFEKFLHHGFKNPRKMLNKVFEKEVLEKAGINPSLRPQVLTLSDWVRLFATISVTKASG